MKIKTDAEVVLNIILNLTKRVSYYKEPNGEITLTKLMFKDGTILTMDEITQYFKPINKN